ncbi:hypothetical protein EDC01DRAFT_315117 [Geopyxis carbonaria]|nr:hypothetical protein EDC01DRAFT_315117 [Geopyxis carbonaria]
MRGAGLSGALGAVLALVVAIDEPLSCEVGRMDEVRSWHALIKFDVLRKSVFRFPGLDFPSTSSGQVLVQAHPKAMDRGGLPASSRPADANCLGVCNYVCTDMYNTYNMQTPSVRRCANLTDERVQLTGKGRDSVISTAMGEVRISRVIVVPS